NATLGGNVNLGAGSSLGFGATGATGGLLLNWGAGSTIGAGAALSADFGMLGLGVGFNGGLLANAGLNVGGSGAFNLNGINTTLGRLTGTGSLSLGIGSLSLGATGLDSDFGGVIGGAGGLNWNGAGRLSLSGANT
ncbi:hypothetical protein JTP77_044595, partial [Streptomyces sp. S9]|nr:hypothetical protein [Streptomyces sp. S9]